MSTMINSMMSALNSFYARKAINYSESIQYADKKLRNKSNSREQKTPQLFWKISLNHS